MPGSASGKRGGGGGGGGGGGDGGGGSSRKVLPMILAVFAGVAASSLVLTFLRVFSMAGSSYQGQQRPPSTHWIPPKVTELHRYPLRYVSPSAVTNPHLSPDRLWASPRSSTSSSSSKASKASKAASLGSAAMVVWRKAQQPESDASVGRALRAPRPTHTAT